MIDNPGGQSRRTDSVRPIRQMFRAGPVTIGLTETTIATIPALWSVEVTRLRIYNQTGSAVTVTAHTYDSGGSAGSTNEFLSESIPTKEMIVDDGGWTLGPGGVVSAIGSASGCIAWLEGEVVTEAKASQ